MFTLVFAFAPEEAGKLTILPAPLSKPLHLHHALNIAVHSNKVSEFD